VSLLVWVVLGFTPLWAQAPAAESCCSVEVKVESETGTPVHAATVLIESGAIRHLLTTGPDGRAELSLRAPGLYTLTATDAGGRLAQRAFEIRREETITLIVVLAQPATRRDSVVVEDRSSPLEPDSVPASATGSQLESLPQRVANVRDSLPLIPGVVRTPEGKLRISGAPEYRSTFLVNSIDVTDAATGSFGPTVPIDMVERLQVYKSPFLAEYGNFSAAVVAVATRRGGQKWHYELNDPTPELRIRSGHIHGVRGFTPRFAATGPVLTNRLYFAGAGSFELRKRPVYPLPFPYNEEKQQAVNIYGQFDYIASARHTLSLSLHGVPQRANFVGLNFYTPQPAAPSFRGHQYRPTVTDTREFSGGALLSSSLSISDNRSLVGGQGNEDLTLTPTTTLGNYPFRPDTSTRRAQGTEVLTLPRFHGAGTHQLKAGGHVGRTWMHGSVGAAGAIRIADLAGAVIRVEPLRSQPGFRLTDTDAGLFVQDGWEPVPTVRLDLGLRLDWQQITRVTRIAPRWGVAWMPFEGARTILRGGFGYFFDRVPLLAYAWPHYPERRALSNTIGGASRGLLAVGGSGTSGFAPRSANLSLAVDQPLGASLLLHASIGENRSRGLLVLQPGADELALSGYGSAVTRNLEVIAKASWYADQQWVISYVRTSAQGDLNTFLDVAGLYPEPVIRENRVASFAEIVPHRFLTWGIFPLRWGLQFAPVAEWRSGFPYSALTETQQYFGTPNSYRLPVFFSFDTRVSKDIAVRGHKVRLSFSMFNVTDHGNYDAVRWNVADPQFGEVLGRRPRRFRVDFDWLF
jgi:hypothetical protein